MRRSTSSKGHGAARLALLAASCLLLGTVGDAFVSASPSFQVTTPKPTWEVKTAQPTNRNGGLVTPNTQVSLFKAAASVALLCLAATRMSKTKTSKSSLRCVMGMTPPSTVTTTSATIAKTTPMEDLLQFEDQPTETVMPPAVPMPLISMDAKTVMCAVESETATTTTTTTSTTTAAFCRARAACFAAGARRSSGRTRTAGAARRARAARAARRAVGQRLCEASAVQPMTSTFDASKTRTKIQLGLRVSSCMRSESGRESKVSSGVEGSEMGTCLNFVAHDLKVYMLDHESALNDAIHSRFGNLAHSAKL